ncbi:hypothetical protein PV11_02813 [Exophiala sideris]|uniref:Carboxylesterase type B domain-containing protein n=1 Tax=Exophiala sideris TaxID=1016849 RepID=A0A0D1YXE8_9EURO|nr:hypothetical protein PV11_02813 [Exophiala sideris]
MHTSALLFGLVGSVAATAIFPRKTATTTSALPSVTLDYCTVQAAAGNSSIGYYKYQNIRYAAVPTGDLRWAKPQWPANETKVNNGSLADADVDCSSEEDCLYMDIWVPANATGKKLPVAQWTYGGGFTAGSKSQNTPEGWFNLTTDFIFVAYNYRLGLTGLATGPTLQHEGGTSNLGLWDAEHAFLWTRNYISKFGGDPDQVTAVGFSAGASNTLFQLTRKAGHAEQLFDRAYVMSPGFVPGAGHHHGEQFWQNVSSAVGCDGGHLDCMRQVNFTALNTAATDAVDNYTYQFQPRVDGDFVADTYESQFYQKRFNFSGPLVITHEQHEANSVAYAGVNTTADVSTYLRIFFPAITDDVVNELLDLYPESDYTSPGLRFADMKQSLDLTAHNLALTQALDNNTWNAEVGLSPATHGTDQDYYWYSTYTLESSSDTSTGTTTGGSTGTSNSTTGGPSGSTGTTSSNTASSDNSISTGPSGTTGTGGESSSVNSTIAIMMQKYLLSFILTGNPNTKWPEDKLYWPKYGDNTTQLIFNDTFSIGTDDLANNRSLYWNKALWY